MEKAIENKTPLTGNFVDISSLKEVTADTRLTVGGWVQENNHWVMYRGDEKSKRLVQSRWNLVLL